MPRKLTKKGIIIISAVALGLLAAVAVTLILAKLNTQDTAKEDTAIVEAASPEATNTINALSTFAAANPTLSQLTVSAPSDTTQTSVFATTSDKTLYELASTHSLTISAPGPLTTELQSSIAASLAIFFQEKGITPSQDAATNAVIAQYANDTVYCSAQGPVGAPSVTVSCEDASTISASITSANELITIAAATKLEKAYVKVSSASDEDKKHTVTLINLSTAANIMTGSLLFTQPVAKHQGISITLFQAQAASKAANRTIAQPQTQSLTTQHLGRYFQKYLAKTNQA